MIGSLPDINVIGSLPDMNANIDLDKIGSLPRFSLEPTDLVENRIGATPEININTIGSLPEVLQGRHLYGKYIIKEWNINGFNSISTPYNTLFKKAIINNLYSDFWILPETHCTENETIELESFTIYQYNRVSSSKCRRGSGGIAIAINNSVLESHMVIGIFRGIDGQLGIKLQNKLNDFLLGIVGYYLSPDSYIYGQDPENFFNEASVIWDDLSDCDLLIGSGDLNARTQQIRPFT